MKVVKKQSQISDSLLSTSVSETIRKPAAPKKKKVAAKVQTPKYPKINPSKLILNKPAKFQPEILKSLIAK